MPTTHWGMGKTARSDGTAGALLTNLVVTSVLDIGA
jgi:hypothetical protein